MRLDETLRLWLICLTLIPVLVTVAWGDVYADAAYIQFSTARAVARGNAEAGATKSAPLYIRLLALAYRGGLALPSVALILSMLGWVLAVVIWFFVGLSMGSRHFAVAAGSLLALHPLHPQVLGLETGLVLAALGGVVMAGIALAGEHTQSSVLSVSATIGTTLLLGTLHPLWLLLAIPVIVLAFIPTSPLPRLLLLFIFWTIILLGIGWQGELRSRLRVALWAMGQLGVAAGFAWAVPDLSWLHNPVANSTTFRRGIALIILISLLLFQAITLLNAWRTRPTEHLRLYKALSAWLHALSLPDEIIGAQRPGIVGYLADRATVSLPKGSGAGALLKTLDDERPDYSLVLASVAWDGVRAQPWFQEHYQIVHQEDSAYASIAPLMLFRYTPSPFDRGERRSVWRSFFATEQEALREQAIATGSSSSQSNYADSADTNQRVELLDYRLSHRRITPGEPVHLTLYWSPTLLASPHGLAAKGLQMHLKLIAPDTQQVWASVENTLPDDLATEFWNLEAPADGGYLIGRHVLWPPEKIPEGDYNLTIALQYQNGRPLFVRAMPAETPEQDRSPGDPVARDHLVLTTLYHPPDISANPFTPDRALQMTLGLNEDRAHHPIALLGYDAPKRVAPGDTVRVALYWYARRARSFDDAQDDAATLGSPEDDQASGTVISGDYKVFVHILSSEGEMIALEDSKPVYWFYPTNQWKPGDYIRDEHILALSPDTPRGDYWITAGMYDPQSGERLEVRDEHGTPMPEQRIPLQRLKVR